MSLLVSSDPPGAPCAPLCCRLLSFRKGFLSSPSLSGVVPTCFTLSKSCHSIWNVQPSYLKWLGISKLQPQLITCIRPCFFDKFFSSLAEPGKAIGLWIKNSRFLLKPTSGKFSTCHSFVFFSGRYIWQWGLLLVMELVPTFHVQYNNG